MSDKTTPLPWLSGGEMSAEDIFTQDGELIATAYRMNDGGCDAAEANAAFIIRAVNSHVSWAKWIVQHGRGLPDHACAECVPGGAIVKTGFQCVYHEAIAALEAK